MTAPTPPRGFHAHRHASAPATGAAMACMTVKRAGDGSYDHYYSLDYVSPLKLWLWLAYRANFHRHLAGLPAGRVWVECPNHPLSWRRKRRRRG